MKKDGERRRGRKSETYRYEKNHSPSLINSLQANEHKKYNEKKNENENEVPWTNKRVKTARKEKSQKQKRNGNANNFLMNASLK